MKSPTILAAQQIKIHMKLIRIIISEPDSLDFEISLILEEKILNS